MAYSGVYVFGDSLVDAGNALKLAQFYDSLPLADLPDGAPTASLGYFQGRFSDGYSFADLVANKTIGMITKPVFPFGFDDPWIGLPIDPFASDPSGINLNFAYGGAQIRQGGEVVPDLDGQTDAFRDAVDGDADPNALYLITIGGNDVRSLVPSSGDPASQAEAYEALDKAADKLLTELSQLVDMGAQHILVTGVPDVGLIPQYDRDGNLMLDAAELLRSEAATEYSIYLDTLIRTDVLPALQAMGATVTYVPLMDYVDASGNLVTGALNANLGTIAALHGLTADELSDNLLQHQDLLFFDQIHPNAQANALLGAYMVAQLTGTPWIETLPLTGADVDYRMSASISAPGEVDSLVVSLVAGTTYAFEMLGMSSLGTAGTLADPALRLLGPSGTLFSSNADDGVGFDAALTFTAATSGSYTIQLSSTGVPTGAYVLQAAVVGGAAMASGNTYTVANASTVVLEAAGGIGQDVVKASVSYALNAGSEIEVLRTINDKGKGAIDLTGNEYGQTIVGNAGANRIEGKGGADVLTGGAGKDVFVLSNAAVTSPGSANIDRITDYAAGDVVDVTQILSVAAGTNVLTGGYLRVTTGGLVQVDLDGGGNDWVTLSTINGNGAVAVRYVSGGAVTNVSVNRVAEVQLRSMSETTSNAALAGAIAAAGLLAAPAAAQSSLEADGLPIQQTVTVAGSETGMVVKTVDETIRSALSGETQDSVEEVAFARSSNIAGKALPESPDANALAGGASVTAATPAELLHGTEPAVQDSLADQVSLVADSVAMPSAEMLQAIRPDGTAGAKATGEVGRILADALSGDGQGGRTLEALLDALPGHADGRGIAAIAGHAFADLGVWVGGQPGLPGLGHFAFAAEAFAVHHDVAVAA